MSVNIKYKNNSIATLTDTGTKTLKTSGKYCEADIIVENTKDGGSGGKVARGSWVQASDSYSKTITHNLGKVPELAVIWETNEKSSAKGQCLIGVALTSNDFFMKSTSTGNKLPYGQYDSSNYGVTSQASTDSVFYDANTTTIKFINLNNNIIAGSSYEYIIM